MPDGAARFAAGRRGRVHKKAGHEFTLLGKYLDSIAAAFTDIDEAIDGDVYAMQNRGERLLIRRRARYVVGRNWIIIDLA